MIMPSSRGWAMSNGPATAAPLGISMAMTTPPSVGSTIQLKPRSWTCGLLARVLHAIDREQHRLEHALDVDLGPLRRRIALVVDFLGDRVVTLAQHDFDGV